MNRQDAITSVLNIAGHWIDNEEECYGTHVAPTESDDACEAIADNASDGSSYPDRDDIVLVRDYRRAAALLTGGNGHGITEQDAIACILDIASRWGENAEEAFARRVKVQDTDADCADNARACGSEVFEVVEVRNLWRAIEALQPVKAVPGNVFQYFTAKLGREPRPENRDLQELETDSICGADCVAAIDTAAAFRQVVIKAYGDENNEEGFGYPEKAEAVRDLCESVCMCFWRG